MKSLLNSTSIATRRVVSARNLANGPKYYDDYCRDLVKSKDHASYVAGLLFPKDLRSVYFALHAYNVEIATIKDQIPRSTVQAGRIRFQFWKDVLQHIYSTGTLPPSNSQPVAHALCYNVQKYQLTSRWLERSLEARYEDMAGSGNFETMDDLETYAEYSQSSLLYLLLEAMGIKHEKLEFAASHVGVCKGIVTLLRGHEAHRQQGSCYFPREVMQKHALATSVALRGPRTAQETGALQDVINDIASQAYAHLSKARELSAAADMPNMAHLVLMPAVDCARYLDQLQKDDFLPVAGNDHMQAVQLQLALLQYMWTKRI